MSTYPEIPSRTIRNTTYGSYFVRKFGLNGVVYEEELVPIPTKKVTRTLCADGTEDIDKRITTPLIKDVSDGR